MEYPTLVHPSTGNITARSAPSQIPFNLRSLRRFFDMTQTDLSKKSGVSICIISNAENGRLLTIETLQRLAAVLKVRRVEDLWENFDESFPNEENQKVPQEVKKMPHLKALRIKLKSECVLYSPKN